MFLIVTVCLWCATLLLGPIFGLYLTEKWNLDTAGRQSSCLYAAGLICVVGLCWMAGVQTDSTIINLLFGMGAFLAYWVIAAALGTVRPRVVGYLVGMIAYIPAIPSVLLATVGIPASAFMLSDYLSPPLEQRRLAAGLSCRVMSWGMVLTDEGYVIHLYRSFPWFPLHLEVATVAVSVFDPDYGSTARTCESVAARWRSAGR